MSGAPRALRAAAVAFVAAMLLFLLAPLVVVMAASLSAGGYLVFPPQGLSLKWYAEVLGDRRWQEALTTSFIIAIISTTIAVPLGTAGAIALTRFRFRGKGLAQLLFLSPLLFPTIVVAIGLLILASRMLGGSSMGVIVAGHVALSIPFVVRTVGAVLEGVDMATEEAARVMGANWRRRYMEVVLPQCQDGHPRRRAARLPRVVRRRGAGALPAHALDRHAAAAHLCESRIQPRSRRRGRFDPAHSHGRDRRDRQRTPARRPARCGIGAWPT